MGPFMLGPVALLAAVVVVHSRCQANGAERFQIGTCELVQDRDRWYLYIAKDVEGWVRT